MSLSPTQIGWINVFATIVFGACMIIAIRVVIKDGLQRKKEKDKWDN